VKFRVKFRRVKYRNLEIKGIVKELKIRDK